jgi:hypothetical protein
MIFVYLFPKETYEGGIVICGNMFLRNALIGMASLVSKSNKYQKFIESGIKDFLNNSNLLFGECKFDVCYVYFIVTQFHVFVGEVQLIK